MNDLIAVVNFASIRSRLKHMLLLGDKIAYPEYHLRKFPHGIQFDQDEFNRFRTDAEYLESQDLLFDPLKNLEVLLTIKKTPEFMSLLEKMHFSLDKWQKSYDECCQFDESVIKKFPGVKSSVEMKTLIIPLNSIKNDSTMKSIVESFEKTAVHMINDIELGDIMALIATYILREREDLRAVPFLHSWDNVPLDQSLKLSTVAEFVFKSFPVPDDDVPIDRIVDFKRDPDTKDKFFRLRRWMSKIATEDFNRVEILEEIEYLIHQYKNHMKLYEMKVNKGTFQTLVILAVEAIENIAKLKLTKAAEQLFILRERKIQLREAELKAPGREIAYILKARETFDPS